MLKKEIVENIIGTVCIAIIAIFFTTIVPFKIVGMTDFQVFQESYTAQVIALLVSILGIIGYLLCIFNFIFYAKGTPLPGFTQDSLMVNGLYKYVRNPMYISWYLILCGEAIFFNSLDLLLYLLAWVIFFQLKVIFLEEPSLTEKFGASYLEYCRLVNRWVPRFKPNTRN